ncbi:oxidoreductase [Streptomyces sp. ISL-96]|nr:oxidoreductase [Streptomyces sp. ISL-96]
MAGTDTGVVRWTALLLVPAVAFLSIYRLLAVRRTDAISSAPPLRRELPGARPVVVQEVRPVAEGVVQVGFVAADGGSLPAWELGAHVEVALPSGRIRPYSLCGDPADRDTHRIAVRHAPDGRGGSAEVHALRVGEQIVMSRPRSSFPLALADQYLFIAGGIGITPLLPMIRAVARAGQEWQLVYGGRSSATMAFAGELLALGGDRVRLVPEDTDGLPDLTAELLATPPGAAVYCCGPEPLIAALEQTMGDFPDRHVHVERFTGTARKPLPAQEFTVELRRTGRTLSVASDRTLLDVIRQVIPGAPASCEEGFCGTCELRVLAGIPDHRDTVLRRDERDRRDVIYPCVSRAHSQTLVVDL